MRFVLFVEGHTERKALPSFLKRWLDPQLPKPVGISTVRFEGWPQLVKDSPGKARRHLANQNVIAVIALLDLYGPTFYPDDRNTPAERHDWAKQHLENQVNDKRFFQFFAVHEVEAWLLSDPSIFPHQIGKALHSNSNTPEAVNNTRPPAKLISQLYTQHTGRRYKKVTHGHDLFSRLDPNTAYLKCPYLKEFLDKMLELALKAS